MKKLFAILLTIAMALPICTPITATETQPKTIEEILDEQFECWTKTARAEYAYVETSFTGTVGMGYSDEVIEIDESNQHKYYSLYYNGTEPLKELAAQSFGASIYLDRTGHIDMYLYDRTKDEYDLIFTLYEPV